MSSVYENLSANAEEQRFVAIRKALAENKSIVYIYLQQLHTLHPQSETSTDVSDTYKKIATNIQAYKDSVLGKIQNEHFGELTADMTQYYTELTEHNLVPDEQTVFRLEALYGSKEVDLEFYTREIDISFTYIIKKIYDVAFDIIQKELKKAEATKDTAAIELFSTQIQNLSIYKHTYIKNI